MPLIVPVGASNTSSKFPFMWHTYNWCLVLNLMLCIHCRLVPVDISKHGSTVINYVYLYDLIWDREH